MLLLPLLILLTFPQRMYAQETAPVAQQVTPTPIAVDYTLPYPGLLPDNPLYSLKVLRDRLISFFISDPLKRSSFDLLQADKRLEAAYYLQKKGKQYDDLVGTTVSKAENYFDDSVQQVKVAKSMGEDVNPQLGTQRTAVLKHQQVIGQMRQTAGSKLQQNLDRELGRLANLEKMVDGLLKE